MLYNECERDFLESFKLHLEFFYPKSKAAQVKVYLTNI